MKYTIQTKILAGFILGLMAIGLIGYEVHNQMTDLASSLYEKSDRKDNLVLYQKILSTISDAESSVRSYSITNEEEDLQLFNESKTKIDRYLALLQKNLKNNTEFQHLHQNVEDKFYVMDRIVELRNENPNENIIDEALNELEQIPDEKSDAISENLSEEEDNAISHQDDEQEKSKAGKELDTQKKSNQDNQPQDEAAENVDEAEKKKKGFFQRLFSRKKSKDKENNRNEETVDANTTETEATEIEATENNKIPRIASKENNSQKPTVSSKEHLAKSLKELKTIKTKEEAIWQDTMLVLIEEDTRIMDEIRIDIAALESNELDQRKQFISAAAKSKDQLINNTKVVGFGAFSIIFLLSFIVFKDFSKMRKNRMSLIDEKEKANRLAQVKENFLANMSHEIRTPMNAIVGFSELLEKTPLDEKQKKYLSTIQHSSGHLMVILNDILDYSKIESGKLTIRKAPFNAKKTIQQVVNAMEVSANKKNLHINLTINKNLRNNLIGDATRLQQVLYNLISNAVKFTDKGEINVAVTGNKKKELYLLEIKVQDNGMGIPESFMDKIFDNFEQASTNRERKHGGTGLGLSIVKKIIDLQNGSINVKSKEGVGSTFAIKIPYEIGKQEKKNSGMTVTDKNKKNPEYKNLSVLAVDDQEYNLELIKIILEKWGARVVVAESGKEAVNKFQEKDFDLVLMDVQMPEMSGLEATNIIRNSGKSNALTIPIIALTAASTKEETDKCIQSGMNGYLLKPFKQKELRQALDHYLQSEENEQPEKQPVVSVTYDLQKLEAVSSGNKKFVLNMLEVFVKNTRYDLKILEKHVSEKKWKSAGLQAHKMIAPSRHLGISLLADLLEKIENNGLYGKNVDEIPELVQETKNIALTVTCLLEEEMKKINNQINKQA